MRDESARVAARVRELLGEHAAPVGGAAWRREPNPTQAESASPLRDPEPASLLPEPASPLPEPASPLPEPASPLPEPASPLPQPASPLPQPASTGAGQDVWGASFWQRFGTRAPSAGSGRRAALAVGAAAAVGVVAVGAWLRSGQSGPPAPAPASLATAASSVVAPAVGAPPSAPTTAPHPTPRAVVVDVAGKVRHPGVYRLPAGARVDDALQAAGGPRPGVNLSGLNLAAVLTDGQQVAVGVRGAAGVGAPPLPAGTGSAASGPVDLNTATLEQLETLPGIGPVLGQQILDWRAQHGRFASVDQLDDVSDIGPARLAELRPLVTV